MVGRRVSVVGLVGPRATLSCFCFCPAMSIHSSRLHALDPKQPVHVAARDGTTGANIELSYDNCKLIGNGSFGVVFQARIASGLPQYVNPLDPPNPAVDDVREPVAIKKVMQDKRFKNRELQIMRIVKHRNVCDLRAFFYTNDDRKQDLYLNLVLEYVPETIYRALRHYAKMKQVMSPTLIKVYMYQLLRSLAYIHSLGICHRDIKPQNLLLNPTTGELKLCDFGSAKVLVPGEPNVSYICSRYYRAPELIFGATNYSTSIDLWSAGCVMAELMQGQPIFPGESGIDQLVEIIKLLGTPTKEEIKQMNQNYMEHKFPHIRPHPLHKVFRPRTDPEAIDLVGKLLKYTPTSRLSAIEAMAHPYFDELRRLGQRKEAPDGTPIQPGQPGDDGFLPNGRPVPPLFDLSRQELSIRPDLIPKLVPAHKEPELRARGIDINNFEPVPLEHVSLD